MHRPKSAPLLWLRLRLGIVASLAAFSATTPVQASETILFNESPAYLCYQAAIEQRDRDIGLEDCDTAIEKQGLATEALAATHSNRGLLLARTGDIEAALKDHDRAVRLAPEIASLFINRANSYTLHEQFLPALQDLDYAIALADERIHFAYYNRALIHRRLGNLEAARLDAEAALASVPESDRYASLLESLRGLATSPPGSVLPSSDTRSPEAALEGASADSGTDRRSPASSTTQPEGEGASDQPR